MTYLIYSESGARYPDFGVCIGVHENYAFVDGLPMCCRYPSSSMYYCGTTQFLSPPGQGLCGTRNKEVSRIPATIRGASSSHRRQSSTETRPDEASSNQAITTRTSLLMRLSGKTTRISSPALAPFTSFSRLLAALRVEIWQHFVLELTTQPLLLQFRLLTCDRTVSKGPSLPSQTVATRAVLGTNQESRRLGLGALPDTLEIYNGVVRFNRERDIVVLHDLMMCFGEIYRCFDRHPSMDVTGFSEQIVHFALNFWDLEESLTRFQSVSCFSEA